ncbi:MAG: alpha/beta fold hydrolase, partial [Chitinophagales bacterium]
TRFYTNLYQSALGNKFMVNMTLNNGLEKTKLSKTDRRGYSLPMREGGGMTLYNFFTSFEDISDNIKDYQKTIKDANVPILVIWGEQDDILQGSAQIPLLQKQFNVPNENIHRLKNAKHFIQEEEPKKIANWIADFVG